MAKFDEKALELSGLNGRLHYIELKIIDGDIGHIGEGTGRATAIVEGTEIATALDVTASSALIAILVVSALFLVFFTIFILGVLICKCDLFDLEHARSTQLNFDNIRQYDVNDANLDLHYNIYVEQLLESIRSALSQQLSLQLPRLRDNFNEMPNQCEAILADVFKTLLLLLNQMQSLSDDFDRQCITLQTNKAQRQAKLQEAETAKSNLIKQIEHCNNLTQKTFSTIEERLGIQRRRRVVEQDSPSQNTLATTDKKINLAFDPNLILSGDLVRSFAKYDTNFKLCMDNIVLYHANLRQNDSEDTVLVYKDAVLHHVVMYDVNLTNIEFENSTLTTVVMYACDASNIKLKNVELTNVNFTRSNLTNVDFSDTRMDAVNFKCCILVKTIFVNKYLADTDLTGANLTSADLTGADLTRANLTGADLTGADLTGADLTRADLTGANLTGADLTGADLTGANLTRADLTGANLTGADLTGADLTGADLTGAYFENAIFTNIVINHSTNFHLAHRASALITDSATNNLEHLPQNLAQIFHEQIETIQSGAAVKLTMQNGEILFKNNEVVPTINEQQNVAKNSNDDVAATEIAAQIESCVIIWQKMNLSGTPKLWFYKCNDDITLCALDFSGKNLNNKDFAGLSLKYARFDDTSMFGTKFDNANLHHASFNDAFMYQVSLNDAVMDEASFCGTAIIKTSAYQASMNSAHFEKVYVAEFRLGTAPSNIEFVSGYFLDNDQDLLINIIQINNYTDWYYSNTIETAIKEDTIETAVKDQQFMYNNSSAAANQCKRKDQINIKKTIAKKLNTLEKNEILRLNCSLTHKRLLKGKLTQISKVTFKQVQNTIKDTATLTKKYIEYCSMARQVDMKHVPQVKLSAEKINDHELIDIIYPANEADSDSEAKQPSNGQAQRYRLMQNLIAPDDIFENITIEVNTIVNNVKFHPSSKLTEARRCQFYSTDMSQTIIDAANFSDTSFYEVKFNRAFAQKASFTGSILLSVDISGTDLREADFREALLDNLVLDVDTDLRGARMANAYFYDSETNTWKNPNVSCSHEWNLFKKFLEPDQRNAKFTINYSNGRFSFPQLQIDELNGMHRDTSAISIRHARYATIVSSVTLFDYSFSINICEFCMAQARMSEILNCLEAQGVPALHFFENYGIDFELMKNDSLIMMPYLKNTNLNDTGKLRIMTGLNLERVKFTNINMDNFILDNINLSNATFDEVTFNNSIINKTTINGTLFKNVNITNMAFMATAFDKIKKGSELYVVTADNQKIYVNIQKMEFDNEKMFKLKPIKQKNKVKLEEVEWQQHSTAADVLNLLNMGFDGAGAFKMITKPISSNNKITHMHLFFKNNKYKFFIQPKDFDLQRYTFNNISPKFILNKVVMFKKNLQNVERIKSAILVNCDSIPVDIPISDTIIYSSNFTSKNVYFNECKRVYLWNCNLSKADIQIRWPTISIAMLRCNLTEVNLSRADNDYQWMSVDVRGSNLSGSKLTNFYFSDLVFDTATNWNEVVSEGAMFGDTLLPDDWVQQCQNKIKLIYDKYGSCDIKLKSIETSVLKFEHVKIDERLPGAVFGFNRILNTQNMIVKWRAQYVEGSHIYMIAKWQSQYAEDIRRCEITWKELQAIGVCDAGIGPRFTVLKNGKRSFDLPNSVITGDSYFALDLRGLNFENKRLLNLDFEGADMTGVSFKGTFINNVNFSLAKLTNVHWSGATFTTESYSATKKFLPDYIETKLSGDDCVRVVSEEILLYEEKLENEQQPNFHKQPEMQTKFTPLDVSNSSQAEAVQTNTKH